jgi:hypothetical protein
LDPSTSGKTKNHLVRNIGLLIILIILAGGAAFYYTYLRGGIAGMALGSIKDPQSLRDAILQKINSYPQLGLAFIGSITANVTANGNDPVVTIPFTIQYLKYNNDSRVSLSIIGNQIAGISNLSATGVSLDNGTMVHLCYSLNGSGFNCAEGTGSPFQILDNLTRAFDIGSFTNFKESSIIPAQYEGHPCWFVSGNGTVSGKSALFNGNDSTLQFSTCIDPDYYAPLFLNATITQSNSPQVKITLNVINITQATNLAQITAMPGTPPSGT